MADRATPTRPGQLLLGLALGAISGVVYPGLFNLLIFTWLIPAVVAGLLWVSPRTRVLAMGFGAASVGWLFFILAFFAFGTFGAAFR